MGYGVREYVCGQTRVRRRLGGRARPSKEESEAAREKVVTSAGKRVSVHVGRSCPDPIALLSVICLLPYSPVPRAIPLTECF